MNKDDIISMGQEADAYANCEWNTESPAHEWKQHRDTHFARLAAASEQPVQPVELTEAEIDAGIMALLQCSESDLESLSPKMYEWYADDVRLRNQYNRGR